MESEIEGNMEVATAIWIMWLCIMCGVFFVFEHPLKSRVWKLPLIIFILALAGVYTVELDQCAWV